MDSFVVRLFRRSDRDQLTALVNAHVQTVVPGLSASTNAVLSQLEREPSEFIVDPWVAERVTLVADQRGRVSAAAHLVRYGEGAEVGEFYRRAAELRWLLCWPDDSTWPDASAAGDAVAAAAVNWINRSSPSAVYADGSLPAPGVYGIPEQWPHIHAILQRAGFVPGERTEIVFLADVAALARPEMPVMGLRLVRTMGARGTRFTAHLENGSAAIGYIEVDSRIEEAGRFSRGAGWADIGTLHVGEAHRRRGVASWPLGQAADWLRLGHIDRLMDYATPDEVDYTSFLHHAGFVELTRTNRGWERKPSAGASLSRRDRAR